MGPVSHPQGHASLIVLVIEEGPEVEEINPLLWHQHLRGWLSWLNLAGNEGNFGAASQSTNSMVFSCSNLWEEVVAIPELALGMEAALGDILMAIPLNPWVMGV